MPSLEAVLNQVKLGRYLGNFVEVGITAPADLVHLTLEDYHTLGIDDINDRKRLFQLIQKVKVGDESVSPAEAAQPVQQRAQPAPQQRPGGPPRATGIRGPSAAPASGLPRPNSNKAPSSGLPRASKPAATRQAPPQQQVVQHNPRAGAAGGAGGGLADNEFFNLHQSLLKIRVAVRLRPLSAKEKKKKEVNAMEIQENNVLLVEEHKVKVDMTKYTEHHKFNYDECIGAGADIEEVYARTVRPLLSATFNQARTTCFAYGQTGSGKTYTMGPLPLRAAQEVLAALNTRAFGHLKMMISVFEIYLSSVFDLLNNRKRLVIREDQHKVVHIVGLEEVEMTSVDVLRDMLAIAEKCRSSAPTHANANSSRSHQVLQLRLKDGEQLYGKMSFIDLAGSEWGADIKDTNRQTRMEGAEINKSLLALKECIRALDRDAGHVPFRGSKLTEVLKDSFIGNSFTMMIACTSPASGSVEHSLNTLRYADRVRELQQPRDKSKPHVDMLTPGALPNTREAGKRTKPPQQPPQQNLAAGNRQPQRPIPDDDGRDSWMNRKPSGSFVVKEEYERDLVAETAQDEVLRMHDELIDTILEEEEQLLNDHRTEIEETMHLVKDEMKLLDMMDNPGTQVDDYVSQLDEVLRQKIDVISQLRDKLKIFQTHLEEEDNMSRAFEKHSYSRFY